MRANFFNCLDYAFHLVTTQIVHNDKITFEKRGGKDFLYVFQKIIPLRAPEKNIRAVVPSALTEDKIVVALL